jgi:hypothetical protein
MFPVTQELIAAMTVKGTVEPKLFFHAHINEHHFLVLDRLAGWQNW